MIAPSALEEYRRVLAVALPRLRETYGVASVGIFGSLVRGEQRADSDLDLLVSFDRVPGMLAFLELERELSERLGVPVDLVMREALDARIADRVLAEVEPL
jgi:predicted nucleotidyltransferase